VTLASAVVPPIAAFTETVPAPFRARAWAPFTVPSICTALVPPFSVSPAFRVVAAFRSIAPPPELSIVAAPFTETVSLPVSPSAIVPVPVSVSVTAPSEMRPFVW
jgi:hypothetical protein